jgi:hypothetical protein
MLKPVEGNNEVYGVQNQELMMLLTPLVEAKLVGFEQKGGAVNVVVKASLVNPAEHSE